MKKGSTVLVKFGPAFAAQFANYYHHCNDLLKLLSAYHCNDLVVWVLQLLSAYHCNDLVVWVLQLLSAYHCNDLVVWVLLSALRNLHQFSNRK